MNLNYAYIVVISIALSSLVIVVQAQISEPVPSKNFAIDAAGATFPFPLIDLWRVEYGEQYPNVSLNYQSIGSGGGIKQHIEKTIDFAASDTPMRLAEMNLAEGTLHIPETIGAIIVAYNLPEIPHSGLQLDGETISKIYLEEITMWNDERITSQNPGMHLPDAQIITAHRSDGSGTTFVFTNYLSTVYEKFDIDIGAGKSVPWVGGIAAAGNEGLAQIVLSTPYTIGYVELAYAHQTGMTFAHIKNGDNNAYIKPSIESIDAASQSIESTLPKAKDIWHGISMVNAPGPNSYPISSMSYLLVYDQLEKVVDSHSEAAVIVHLIYWMLTEGQTHSESLQYVPISSGIAQIGIKGLESITYRGVQILGSEVPIETDIINEGGGCLIATAAYGTELAPQVQMLREVRDSVLGSTIVGTSFMSGFNQFYYSFSPAISNIISENQNIQNATRVFITPMITTLSIMSYAESGSETDVLGIGIGVIALNVGMYIGIPAFFISKAWNRFIKRGAVNC